MKMTELEKRLKRHAEITKAAMHSPFSDERKDFIMTKKPSSIKRLAVLAAAALFIVGTTAFAAFRLLSAGEVAENLGNSELAKYFKESGAVSETVSDGAYKATVLGITSGRNLSIFGESAQEISAERTYAVVAVEKADGTAMTFDDEILVTPLIQGLKPWQYNIFTMNGGHSAVIRDGVLYRIIEFDSVEYFADREVYMAVLSRPFLNNTAYSFDEATGRISPKDDFDGTNILIKLKLDRSKADPEKARAYLDGLKESGNDGGGETADGAEETAAESSGESESAEIYGNGEFSVETDKSEGETSVVITEKEG